MSVAPSTAIREAPGAVRAPAPPASQRLMSLDFFRGATIALMVLVNNPGDERTAYWPLKHADWNGWTPTDLVFPFFLFIVGVAMAFSLRARVERGASRSDLVTHVLWRGLVLFALGVFLNGFPNHYQVGSLRIYGVLQRIAICYVISALLILWTGRRAWIFTILACLVGYWAIMRFVPVPGFGVPTHAMPILDPDRNLVAWLDRKLLMGHLYEGRRDPEGLISTIPAVATCMLGVLTGERLRSPRSQSAKAWGMVGFGIAALIAGKLWNIWFPINKKLWTSSFVLFTAGLALLGLALCYWILDIKRRHGRWSMPFIVFGMNAIAAYVFAEIISHWLDGFKTADHVFTWQEWIYQRFFSDLASPKNSSLIYGLVYLLMCWVVMWVLYRKRIFLKI
ncbi:MAG TPA: heparan-alpha-glucosaminide N-acetyltransferase domain-containing protein [Terriglobales bacterium]|nr:heparan-alpha-glucosaminide N-acetyltransferase domain-containing protein [Terriglobales bacterium]